MRIAPTRGLRVFLTLLVSITGVAPAAVAQDPTFIVKELYGSPLPSFMVTESESMQLIVSICTNTGTSIIDRVVQHSWPGGSEQPTLQDGYQGDCTGGLIGEAWMIEITLRPGMNLLDMQGTNGLWGWNSRTIEIFHIPPYRAKVVAPGDGGIRMQPKATLKLPFTLINTGSQLANFNVTVSCTGPFNTCRRVNGNQTSFTIYTVNPGQSITEEMTVTADSANGTGTLRVIAIASGGIGDTASTPLAITSAPIPAPIVARLRDTVKVAVSTTRNALFRVENPDPFASRTISLSATCGTLTSCSTSPGSVPLGPGKDTTVTVSYSVPPSPPTQTTKVVLTASASSPTHSVKDSSWVKVGSVPAAAVTVSVSNVNPGTSIARNQCLNLSAWSASSVECGVLRMVQSVPAIRTMGIARAPTLLYSSAHAEPLVLVAANVSVTDLITTDSVKATLTIPSASITVNQAWAWSAACASAGGCRIVVPVNAVSLNLATGKYDYSLEVKIGNGGSPPTGSTSGSIVVVNDRQSVWGAGWWLGGLERLQTISGSTSMLWIGADGSTRVYVKQNDSTYTVTALVDRPDTLKKLTSTWHRRLRNGGKVEFDANLRHTKTINRQGHETRFVYDGSTTRLDSIVLPVPSGGANRSFRFSWDNSASPIKLTGIKGNGPAGSDSILTTIIIDSDRRITQARGPVLSGTPADTVFFNYVSSSRRIASRRDREAGLTTYTYDTYGTVTRIARALGTGDTIVTRICATEVRSLTTCDIDSRPATPLGLERVQTLLDGPRSDVVDVTRFYLNRFASPDTIIDALGGRMRLERSNGTFPALVTKSTDPGGLVTRATYTSRGLPDSTIVTSPYGDAYTAVTTTVWDSKWDMATAVHSTGAPSTYFGYDASTGNRTWQRHGGHDSTKVEFGFDAYNRPATIDAPGTGVSTLTYETSLGNLWKSTTPMGFLTEAKQNGIGADTSVWTPTDSAQTSGYRLRQRYVLDLMGRVTREETIAPAIVDTLLPVVSDVITAPARTQVVKTTYDKEGRAKEVKRFTMPDSSSGATAGSTFTYDHAGRVRTKTEDHISGADSTFYDVAGNVTGSKSRRGLTTTQTFDPLGRVITRSVPLVSYTRNFCGQCYNWPSLIPGADSVWNFEFGSEIAMYLGSNKLVIPSEVTTYGYDAAGRIVQADNPWVRIRRGYYPNGMLKADTSWVRTYGSEAEGVFDASLRSVLSFTYDSAGRRLTRSDHNGGLQKYAYDILGQLSSTTDRATSTAADTVRVNFSYDALGRLRAQGGHGFDETWTYDPDGRPTSRDGEVFSDYYRYDARGKRIAVEMNGAGPGEQAVVYDGIGQVVASANSDRPIPTTDRVTLDGFGNATVRHANRLASQVNTEMLDTAVYEGHRLKRRRGTWYPEGRFLAGGTPWTPVVDSLEMEYDASGNVTETSTIRLKWHGDTTGFAARDTMGGHSWTFNFYDASERLRFAQRTQQIGTANFRSIFDEYWYDALGRRVLVRTRVDSLTGSEDNCPLSQVDVTPIRCQQPVTRTTWDGDQVLFESRLQGGWQSQSVGVSAGSSSWWGTVRYTQTGAIDQPVVVWKNNATPRSLHRNWRGQVAGARFAFTGALDESTVWPAALINIWLAPDARQELPEENLWLGSMITDSKDATGTLYRRNRYYDPSSGQFTQLDPIGLAGGLNLYGFAAGDPVNYSDPFGLCQEKNGTKRPCKVEWSSEASNTNVTDETRKVAQAIADAADVDLVLSSGRRAEGSNCAGSRHNCGKAFDIKAINGVDIGQGQDFNPEALDLVVRVQATAFGMSQVRENFGPAGILKSPAAGQPQAAVTWDARAPNNIWLQHRNHVHISIH